MNTALNTPLLNTPLSPGMRELTLDEIDQVGGAWDNNRLMSSGTDMMALGGMIAAVGAIATPLVPDGELVGAGWFLGGAILYGMGRIGSFFHMA